MVEGILGIGYFQPKWEFANTNLIKFGVKLGGNFSSQDRNSAETAVKAVSQKLADLHGGTPWGAFKYVFGLSYSAPLVMDFENCIDCKTGAEVKGRTLIQFSRLSPISELRRVNHIVHELGHVFHWAMVFHGIENNPYDLLGRTQKNDPTFPDRLIPPVGKGVVGPHYGFASPQKVYTWQQNPSERKNEEFADQFLGWTFGEWHRDEFGLTTSGRRRSDWMKKNMELWIDEISEK